jgi:choline/ethanolamine kinase
MYLSQSAERNLGPKLHGIFPGGRLEEFITGQSLTSAELRSPVSSMRFAANIAGTYP